MMENNEELKNELDKITQRAHKVGLGYPVEPMYILKQDGKRFWIGRNKKWD